MSPRPVADALLAAVQSRATGQLTLTVEGRPARLWLREGDLVGTEEGTGFQTPAQALLVQGRLGLDALDALWARGAAGAVDEELLEAVRLAPEEVHALQVLAQVRRLGEVAEAAAFEAGEVPELFPPITGARAVRAALEPACAAEASAPRAWRCTDAAAGAAWAADGDERAWLARLADFTPDTEVPPARRALLLALERAGLAESVPLEAWTARRDEARAEAATRAALLQELAEVEPPAEAVSDVPAAAADAPRAPAPAAPSLWGAWGEAVDEVTVSSVPALDDTAEEPETPGAAPAELDAATAPTPVEAAPALTTDVAPPVESAEAQETPPPLEPPLPEPDVAAPAATAWEASATAEPVASRTEPAWDSAVPAASLETAWDRAVPESPLDAAWDSAVSAPAVETGWAAEAPVAAAQEAQEPAAVARDATSLPVESASAAPEASEALVERATASPEAAWPLPEEGVEATPDAAWPLTEAAASSAWPLPEDGAPEPVWAAAPAADAAWTPEPAADAPAEPGWAAAPEPGASAEAAWPPSSEDAWVAAPSPTEAAWTAAEASAWPAVAEPEAVAPPEPVLADALEALPEAELVPEPEEEAFEGPQPAAPTSAWDEPAQGVEAVWAAPVVPAPQPEWQAAEEAWGASPAAAPEAAVASDPAPALEAPLPWAGEPAPEAGQALAALAWGDAVEAEPAHGAAVLDDLQAALRRAGAIAEEGTGEEPVLELGADEVVEPAPLADGGFGPWQDLPEAPAADLPMELEVEAAPVPEADDSAGAVGETATSDSDGLDDWAAGEGDVADDPSNPDEAARLRRQRLLRRAIENLGTLGPRPPQPSAPVSAVPVEPQAAAAPAAGLSAEEARLAQQIEQRHAALASRPDHFALLGVPRDAPRDQVKAAFLQQAKSYHPDRLPAGLAHLAPKISAVFEAVRSAYEVLYDDVKRKAYVAGLQRQEAAQPPPAPSGDDPAELAKRAEQLLRKRDFAAAEELFAKAHALAPRSGAYLAGRAWALYLDPERKADAARAKQWMQEALRLEPTCDRAHYQLGVLARVEGDPDKAERHFREAVRTNPKHLEASQELRLIELRKKAPAPKKGLFR